MEPTKSAIDELRGQLTELTAAVEQLQRREDAREEALALALGPSSPRPHARRHLAVAGRSR